MKIDNSTAILWLGIVIAAFFIGRKIALWYWKTDVLIKLQQEQVELLRALVGNKTIEAPALETETIQPQKEDEKPANSSEIYIVAGLIFVAICVVFYLINNKN
ncbi:MAG TPA: hypothetical protein VKG26_10150 [Bacteroidia bacterium]|nr:hypothetical protein [Bacteroidia bacterium]